MCARALSRLGKPDAVFIGGGLDAAMFDALWSLIADGTRIVAHAVTLETEQLLSELHRKHGGDLMRIEMHMLRRSAATDRGKPCAPSCNGAR